MQVEAGESKLLLFETFSLIFFFFTRASYRGARAPKIAAIKCSLAMAIDNLRHRTNPLKSLVGGGDEARFGF